MIAATDEMIDTRMPSQLPADTARLVPYVTEALRAWDQLQLEIGAAAVVTQGQSWSPVFELVASWYGAFPIKLGLSDGGTAASDVDAAAALGRILAPYPLVCAVELSGRADVVDLLLEAIPPSSRVLFAGPRRDRFTIDYYVNVHRKGLHLSSTVLSAAGEAASDPRLGGRATRLLASPARAQACRAAVDAGLQAK